MHWAAELGQEAKCKMLIRLGADSLKRDPNKNTPADVAKLNRHVGLHEILKWASRKQKNGSVVPTGGLIGESEMDRKARILRDDAEFARWKRCKPCLIKETTYDRQKKLPIHMQRRQWSGPLPNLVDRPRDVFKELSRHMSFWSTEQVALWISTEESLIEIFHNNSQDYNRRILQCKVTGKNLAYLHPIVTGSNDPLTQFLGMLDFPPFEKKHIIKAIGNVLERQQGLAPKEFQDTMNEGIGVVELFKKSMLGDQMLKREAQRQWDYHTLVLNIAIGKRSNFHIIGSLEITPLTSIAVVWDRIVKNDDLLIEIQKKNNELYDQYYKKPKNFILTTPRDNRRLCIMSSESGISVAPDVSEYLPDPTDRSYDDGLPPVNVNGPSKTKPTSPKATESKFGTKIDDETTEKIHIKLSGKQIDDALQYVNVQDPIYAHVYPLLLLQPAEQEVLRGVEWTGTRMCRQWIPPSQLKNCDEAWKLAHKYKIEGFESKKKWAEEKSKALDEDVQKNSVKKALGSPTKKNKKWS